MRIGWILEKTLDYQHYLQAVFRELSEESSLYMRLEVFRRGDWDEYSDLMPSHFRRRLHNALNAKPGTFETARWSARYDVIHLQQSFLIKKLLPFVGLAKRPRIVVTLRGGDTYVKPWIDVNWQTYFSLDREKSLIDIFIVQSQDQAEYLSAKWGVSRSKICVSGVSSTIPIAKGPRRLPKDGPVIITSVFRLTWEKNILESLLFLTKIRDAGVDFEYHICGSGDQLGESKYLVDRLGLADRVKFHGKCSKDALRTLLHNSHFILQLSISEALSASLLEAQSLGIVPVVYDVGGIPEATCLGNRRSSISVPLGEFSQLANQFVELVKQPAVYAEKSEIAKEIIRSKFTVDHEVRRLMSIYSELMTS